MFGRTAASTFQQDMYVCLHALESLARSGRCRGYRPTLAVWIVASHMLKYVELHPQPICSSEPTVFHPPWTMNVILSLLKFRHHHVTNSSSTTLPHLENLRCQQNLGCNFWGTGFFSAVGKRTRLQGRRALSEFVYETSSRHKWSKGMYRLCAIEYSCV